MNLLQSRVDRRQFLKLAAAMTLAPSVVRGVEPASEDVSFFLVGDTHYYASKETPTQLDDDSKVTNSRLVDWLNKLPGSAIPEAAGGGTVGTPKGVIHAGDVIDSGDKGGGTVARKQQETEWAAFTADWGLNGGDAKLKYPAFEVHGNHDGPRGDGPAVSAIIERNKSRKNLAAVSGSGLHYAWTWSGVHFLNLGIVVGGDKSVSRARRYDPKGSLPFLTDYLAKHVGKSGAPVMLTHHVDMARYSQTCDPQQPVKGNPEWDPCDVAAYYRALDGYNVLALMYGHTHVRKVYRWDGTPKESQTAGYNVFNTDNAAHFAGEAQAFLHFTVGAKEMTVREFATKDRWATGIWTPQVWRFPVKRG